MEQIKTIIACPENQNNPYDCLGQQHNYLMSSMIKNFGQEIDNHSNLHARQEFIKLKTNELTQYFFQSETDLNCLNTVYGYDGLYSNINFENYQPIIEHFNMPNDDKIKLIEFYNQLTQISLDNSNKVSQAISLAFKLEMEILTNIEINNSIVLGATAMTRYSLFWGQTNLNPDDQPALKIKWGHVIADAVGGLAGGLLSGGVGILAGAVAGTTIYDKCTV